MNKKQITALINSIVASIVATANADGGDDPLTEEEARTLLGMRLKRLAKKLVAEAVSVELEDVVWVDAVKTKIKDDSDDALVA